MIIGLTGPAGAGKNTVADYLVSVFSHSFYQVSFAEPIKEYLPFMLGIPREYFEDRQLKETVIDGLGKSPRQIMQTLGTDWGREMVHPMLWEIVALRKIKEIRRHSPMASIVITDVRFGSEANLVRQQGGQLWHIVRPNNPLQVNPHKSENPIRRHKGEPRLINDGTLAQLTAKIDALLAQIANKESDDDNIRRKTA